MPLSENTRFRIFVAIFIGNTCFMGLIVLGASQRRSQGPNQSGTPKSPKPSAALTQPLADREGVTWTARQLAWFLRSSRVVVPDAMNVQTGVPGRPVYDFIKAGKVVLQVIQFDAPQKAQDFSKDRKGEWFVWGRFAIVGEKLEVEAARKVLVKKEKDAADQDDEP
jgi:hypothetical protein